MGGERLAEHHRRLLRHDRRTLFAPFAEAVKGLPPRKLPTVEPYLRLSGTQAMTLRPDANFINIGERTNVTGSPKFAKLIFNGDYEEALSVPRSRWTTARRSLTSTWMRECWTANRP